jgi:hypothetical protein
MEDYLHRVYGIYAQRHDAEAVWKTLTEAGFGHNQIELLERKEQLETPAKEQMVKPDSDEVRNDILVDSAIGTAIGAGAGAIGEALLASANISLFIASPIISTLMMIGWGASAGAIVGVAAGAGDETRKDFERLVKDAVDNGYYVLIVKAMNEAQTKTARQLIGDSTAKNAVAPLDGTAS